MSTDREASVETEHVTLGHKPTEAQDGDDPRQRDVLVGARLRQFRKARGLSLEEVAQASELTKSFLSLVERDQTAASVASLIRICEALDVSIGSLFDGPRTALVRASDRPRINFGGEGVVEYLLTRANSRLQVIQSYIEPLGGGGDQPYSLSGEVEFVLVLEGTLEVRVSDVTHELQSNDSLMFSPGSPHTWRNPSRSEQSVVLWVLTPSPW